MRNRALLNFLEVIKQVVRFFYYREERLRAFREPRIKRIQNMLIKEYDAKAKKLILFMVSGADRVTGVDNISGGIISIVSLCEESRALKSIHNSQVLMCTFPRQYLLLKHTKFQNATNIFRFSQLENYFKKVNDVVIHLPEFLCTHFMDLADKGEMSWLKKMNKVHINVLNQNIRCMPPISEIERLKGYATIVTATSAHQQYCTLSYRQRYNIPLHKFSVWISPEKYTFREFSAKENLIVVSPDEHPVKETIMKKLSTVYGLKVQVIHGLTYEQYKETISKAKWTLTFGEGLDGYLIEPIFSGAIGFAVYNEDFFTEDFKNLKTIYTSHEVMVESIISDIERFDNVNFFSMYQTSQYKICAQYYSYSQYQQNIISFYKGDYTFK